ncbi:TorF family putative porin [Herbaspirillum sp. GCM10030257]|uniref:TorF family putative porin n=1 Tax=Herbaspirillum sp. GCM10030257 TaxID=3273393 RepID=UPI00362147D1
MKKIILAAAICATFSGSASAQQAAVTETPEHSFTGNLTLASDYRFRGISQTFGKPTIQGGFDYAHSSGFYVGNWNSNVSGVQYPGGASLEMDFYAGYKFTPVEDLTADVGLLYYYYPGATIGTTGEKFDNTEIYIGATYKWFSAKYSHGVSDFFGLNSTTAFAPRGGSKGSGYLDLAANFEIAEKTTLTFHVGHQKVRRYGEFDYTDYKVGVARDFGFATLGLAVVGTNADEAFYTATNGTKSRDLGKTTAVLSLSKTF